MKYTYLIVDLASIAIPLAFSFHPRLKFYLRWKEFFPAALAIGAAFIAWDVFFTSIGVWGFNPKYLTGVYFFNLPMEEWLFFICIPYACLFTYHCLNILIQKDFFKKIGNPIFMALAAVLIVLGILFFDRLYTRTTFLLAAGLILVHLIFIRESYLGRFLFAYIVTLIPFFIVNGILTGSWISEEVVWYNSNEIIGVRLGTIPVEDSMYGMLLLLAITSLYEYLIRTKKTIRYA